MKKIILSLALLLAISPITASAYTVKPGDTLWKIAKANNTTWQQIAEDNNIENPNLIFAGQELSVGQLGAVTPQPRLLGDNTWTGTNTFSGTTTLGTMSATNGSINNLDITFNGTSFTKLTQGQALSIGDGTSVAINRDINTTANIVKKTQIGDTQWVAWIFTTPDTGVTSTITTTTLKFNLTHSGVVSSDNIILSIRSISGGSPTGSDLTSTTISGDVWGVTQGDRIFTANFNYELTPNTQYALVVRLATNGDGIKSFYGNYLSTNSGSTWSAITSLDSAPSSDIRYNATTTAGKLFPSSAYSSNSGLKFVGFAGESVNNNSLISVITGFPVYYGASGLTSGSYYYLSDYPGVVSSTAGSVTKRIGIAVSSTALKIDIID